MGDEAIAQLRVEVLLDEPERLGQHELLSTDDSDGGPDRRPCEGHLSIIGDR